MKSANAESPGKLSPTRRAFALHGWLGLSLGVPLLIICLSGALAVFGHELDWLFTPAMRVAPEGPRQSFETLHTTVARAFPEAKITYWTLPASPRFADEFELFPRGGDFAGDAPMTRVYVNAHTGAIQGTGRYLNIRSFLRAFHYYWFDRLTGWGFYLVAAFAFVLLGSVITGWMIYKRWWAGLFTLRLGRGRRVLFSDLHKLCGAWTLAFNLLIAVTAIYYLIENIFGHDWDLPSPSLTAERVAQIAPNAVPLSLDRQIENARRLFPELRVANIGFPETREAPLYFDGQATAWFVRERANKLLLDPYDGSLVFLQRAENLGPGWRWVDTVDPLHFGNFAGLGSKILWSLLGLALPALVLTGSWLSLRRAGPQAWKNLREFRHPLNALGVTLSAALLLFALGSTILGVRASLGEEPLPLPRENSVPAHP